MIEKKFIPYELALELKQLGFDEPCLSYYDKEEKLCRSLLEYPIINSKNGFHHSHNIITAPLFQQAFRFFREKGIYFEIVTIEVNKEYENHFQGFFTKGYITYEEAELACLKKLIELVKNK